MGQTQIAIINAIPIISKVQAIEKCMKLFSWFYLYI